MRDTHALESAILHIALTVGEEGHQEAERAFGEAFGVVPCEDHRRLCLRQLGGGRCLRRGRTLTCDGCGFGPSVFDHVALWRRPGERRPTVLTSQPYGGDTFKARRLATRFGLTLLVDPDLSWHMPGATTLFVFDATGTIR